MRGTSGRNRLLAATLGLLMLLIPPAIAGVGRKPKKIKASANPPQYVAFSRLLPAEAQLHHALDRLTFGPRAGDVDRVRQIGLDKWLDLQLHPERVAENPALKERLMPLDSLRMSVHEAYVAYPPRQKMVVAVTGEPEKPPEDPQLRREFLRTRNPQQVVATDLSEAKLLRAIYSNHQLEELLVDFWFNHFNVFLNKGADRYLVTSYERDAIRPYVFGKFYDLLLATAQSPAMLFYLDNWQSVGPDSVAADRARPNQKNRRGLNENYGRELLELHTLGVDGGYTQRDVIEVARCFTGWTIAAPRKGGEFEYNDKMHDKGQKVVLGHGIPAGGGMNDGIEVLKILAHEPATAHHISLELTKRFVADDPPPSLVNRMEETFRKTDGDLREVMRTMISSPEFWSDGAYRAKVKTPFEMVASAARATNADVASALRLVNELQKLGEPLYRKIEPTGYSSANVDWVSSAGLLDRMNFALALAHNRVPGVKVDVTEWQSLAARDPMDVARSILGVNPSAQTKAAIEKMLESPDVQMQLAQNAKAGVPQTPSLVAGLVLGSPEFQRR